MGSDNMLTDRQTHPHAQGLDGLAQKLVPRIAEHPLGLGIDQDDRTGPVDHDHGARRGFDNGSEPPLAGNCQLSVARVRGPDRSSTRYRGYQAGQPALEAMVASQMLQRGIGTRGLP